MPHFGHVTALAIVEVSIGVLTNVVIDVRTMSSRSGFGRRITAWRVGDVGVALHTLCGIDAAEPVNMRSFLAFE